MQASIFLAQLIGPTLLLMGAGILVNPRGYRVIVREFLSSRALIYLAGLLSFVPGLAVVLAHNVWAADWRLIITLLGWLSLVAGTLRMLVPQKVAALGWRTFDNAPALMGAGIVLAALGATLSVFGYLR